MWTARRSNTTRPTDGAAVDRKGMSEDEILCFLGKAARRDQVIFIVSPPEHHCLVGAAEARHRLNQRVENRLEIDGRAADDLEHVGGSGLLLQDSLKSSVRSRSSLSSRVFSMAITACLAKLLTSSICLSVNGRTS